MSGIMLHVDLDKRWIRTAIPDAAITVIRLRATEASLLERLDRREVDAAVRDAQAERTLRQAKRMDVEPPGGLIMVATDGRSPAELAAEILDSIGWLEPSPPAEA